MKKVLDFEYIQNTYYKHHHANNHDGFVGWREGDSIWIRPVGCPWVEKFTPNMIGDITRGGAYIPYLHAITPDFGMII